MPWTGTTLSSRPIGSKTLARKRLREIKAHLVSVHAMQHSLYETTGCRTELSCIYDWLAGVRCPDGRVVTLNPPVRYFVNDWISSFDDLLPSEHGPFEEEWWWTKIKDALIYIPPNKG